MARGYDLPLAAPLHVNLAVRKAKRILTVAVTVELSHLNPRAPANWGLPPKGAAPGQCRHRPGEWGAHRVRQNGFGSAQAARCRTPCQCRCFQRWVKWWWCVCGEGGRAKAMSGVAARVPCFRHCPPPDCRGLSQPGAPQNKPPTIGNQQRGFGRGVGMWLAHACRHTLVLPGP